MVEQILGLGIGDAGQAVIGVVAVDRGEGRRGGARAADRAEPGLGCGDRDQVATHVVAAERVERQNAARVAILGAVGRW